MKQVAKMPSLVHDTNIVKIAVKYKDLPAQLIEFNQAEPLMRIIQSLCPAWNIRDHDDYALIFDTENMHQMGQFVTEKNRRDVKNGTVLELRLSPTKTTQDILASLKDGNEAEKLNVLEELARLSADWTFAMEFIAEKGLALLIDAIENKSWSMEILAKCLLSVVELFDHGTVSVDVLTEDFIARNIEFVKSYDKHKLRDLVSSALNILENIVANGSRHTLVEKEFLQNLECLFQLLADKANPSIQQNTLALVNALFIRSQDDATRKIIFEKFCRKGGRDVLLRLVLNPELGQELSHQLYVFQARTLGLLKLRMRPPTSTADQHISDQIKFLRRRAFEGDNNESHNDSAKIYNKKLGFKCDFNPIQDFMDVPPGLLALELMVYFAEHHEHSYKKVVHESSVRSDEHDMPFGRTSIELIKVLLDVLRIGKTPLEQSQDIQPIFFTHDHAFEELFCTSITTLNRTWKDMRATTEDFPKVFSVVREQITRTLQSHPKTMVDFTTKISTFTYAHICKLRQQERDSREEVESTAPAIVNLKKKITPEILELIKQQRLQYMCDGSRFLYRSSNNKNKPYYLRLSPNYKELHYCEAEDKSGQSVPPLDDMKHKYHVNEMRQLLVGKDCPSAKNNRKHQYVFAFTVDTGQQETQEFVASDESTFNHWIDGINVLLNQPMESGTMKEEFDALLSMEIKLRLLDTEGIDISRDPPPVPEEPDNYNFCFES